MPATPPPVRICHLYPEQMSIYADRGNIAVLVNRLRWRGLGVEVSTASVGVTLEPGAHDLYYLGGGQDRDQLIVTRDLLATKADALRDAQQAGAAQLYVCGGYQLAGHGYTLGDGTRLDGLGLLDVDTTPGETRLIGDAIINASLSASAPPHDGAPHVDTFPVVGYENHIGRTVLGPAATPLGQVTFGSGNNGTDGTEGAVAGHTIGTYLHGPLLPRNPRVADIVLGWALQHRTGNHVALDDLDDRYELAAHASAVARAGVRRTSARRAGRPARLVAGTRRRIGAELARVRSLGSAP